MNSASKWILEKIWGWKEKERPDEENERELLVRHEKVQESMTLHKSSEEVSVSTQQLGELVKGTKSIPLERSKNIKLRIGHLT
jgi:hypothetical protein